MLKRLFPLALTLALCMTLGSCSASVDNHTNSFEPHTTHDGYTVLDRGTPLADGRYVLPEGGLSRTEEEGASLMDTKATTLCLNGQTFDVGAAGLSMYNAVLVIGDCSSVAGSLKSDASVAPVITVHHDCALTLDNGSILSNGTAAIFNDGSVTVSGGSVSAAGDSAVYIDAQGELIVTGGRLESDVFAVMSYGKLYLSGTPTLAGNEEWAADICVGAPIFAADPRGVPYMGEELTLCVPSTMEPGAVVVYNVTDENADKFTLIDVDGRGLILQRVGSDLVLAVEETAN